MTSQDSLIKTPPEKTEDRARIEAALKVASECRDFHRKKPTTPDTWACRNAIEQIIRILGDGRSS